MKSAFWRVIALALIAVLVPSMAFAGGEVARSAMAGTNFMNTSADTWVLFHRAMDGEGFGEFVSEGYDYVDEGDPEGFGRLILPLGNYRLGIEVNDAATGSNLVDYSGNGGAYRRAFTIGGFIGDEGPTGNNGFNFGQMVTAKLGFAAGEGGASVGLGIYNHTDEDNEAETKDASTGFTFNGSWGNGAPATAGTIEVAAEFTVHSDKTEDGVTPANDEELSGNHIGLDARYSISDNSHLEGAIVILGSDYETDAGSDTYGVMGFQATYARDLIEEESRGAVAEVGLAYSGFSYEPDGASEQTTNTTTIPSFRFSGWNQISKRFTLFGGVEASWSSEAEEDSDSAVDESTTGDSFDWSAGLGFNPNENVMIEIFLLTDNLGDGLTPGSTTPLVGGIGAHAAW